MSTRVNTTVILVCVTVAFVVSVAAAATIGVVVDDPDRAAALIGLIVAPLASFVPALLILVKLGGHEERLDAVANDTRDLTNGLMGAQVRAAVSDVLRPELVDPEARDAIHTARRILENRENGDLA